MEGKGGLAPPEALSASEIVRCDDQERTRVGSERD